MKTNYPILSLLLIAGLGLGIANAMMPTNSPSGSPQKDGIFYAYFSNMAKTTVLPNPFLSGFTSDYSISHSDGNNLIKSFLATLGGSPTDIVTGFDASGNMTKTTVSIVTKKYLSDNAGVGSSGEGIIGFHPTGTPIYSKEIGYWNNVGGILTYNGGVQIGSVIPSGLNVVGNITVINTPSASDDLITKGYADAYMKDICVRFLGSWNDATATCSAGTIPGPSCTAHACTAAAPACGTTTTGTSDSCGTPCTKTGIACAVNSCAATIPTCDGVGCSTIEGAPSSVNQAWAKGATSCGFSCINGYTGPTCSTPPAKYCDPTLPCDDGVNCNQIQSPTGINQAWAKGATSCGFSCINGYTGANCEIPGVPKCYDVQITYNGSPVGPDYLGSAGSYAGTQRCFSNNYATQKSLTTCPAGIPNAPLASGGFTNNKCVYSFMGSDWWGHFACVETSCSPATPSCDTTLPVCNGVGCAVVTGTPSSVNQAWAKGATSCGFSCINGYTGPTCSTPPAAGNCMSYIEDWSNSGQGGNCSATIPAGYTVGDNQPWWTSPTVTLNNTTPGYTGSVTFRCIDSDPPAGNIAAEWTYVSGSCNPIVVAPTCSDGIKNGSETGIDCGGSCGACAASCSAKWEPNGTIDYFPGLNPSWSFISTDSCLNASCDIVLDDGDFCIANYKYSVKKYSCACAPAGPTCSDGVKNGSETGVDCGGSCGACSVPVGECSYAIKNIGSIYYDEEESIIPTGMSRYHSLNTEYYYVGGDIVIDETAINRKLTCPAIPTCSDGIKNGSETAVDCGGSCGACATECVLGHPMIWDGYDRQCAEYYNPVSTPFVYTNHAIGETYHANATWCSEDSCNGSIDYECRIVGGLPEMVVTNSECSDGVLE